MTEYQVRLLTIRSKEQEAAGEAVTELVGEIVQRAPDSFTDGLRLLLFYWDPVYCVLTVTFSDPARTREGRDVLKLVFRGWDREIRSAGLMREDLLMEQRGKQIYSLLKLVAGTLREAFAELFPNQRLEVGFTTDLGAARLRSL